MNRRAAAADAWDARQLGDLLDVLAARSAPVGGGSAAALAAAMAAALLERCASEAGAASAQLQAAALRAQIADLVHIDAAALLALMHGSAESVDAAAVSAPMVRLRELACHLGKLAGEIERDATPWLRGEARCACILAGSAEHAAGAIIAENSRLSPSEPAPGHDAGGAEAAIVDLAPDGPGSGPRWGMQSEELNATLLTWPAGHEIGDHLNDEREVMLVVLAGCARIRVDGVEHHLSGDQLLLIPRGCTRAIVAGPAGVRYLSTHRRRGPLLPTARSDR